MRPVILTLAAAAQMREMDRIAIEERGIPSLELMEHAAEASADVLWELIKKRYFPEYAVDIKEGCPCVDLEEEHIIKAIADRRGHPPRVTVFCGPGNNGGDGVAAARLLMERGCEVRAFLVGKRDSMTRDCREMEQRLIAAGGKLEDFDPNDRGMMVWLSGCEAVMDALFGVGLNREVGGDFKTAIQWINQVECRVPVVSCDIPSGIHADTGAVLGIAVKADATVTFTCGKPGLYLNQGRPHAGEVHIADIGIPNDLEREMLCRQSEPVQMLTPYGGAALPRRPRTAHKGDFGKVFILAGCEGYTGAPVLAANAAVRAGAGLVFLGVPRSIYPIVAVKCDEAMPFPLMEDYPAILEKAKTCDIALIGPGLGRAKETEKLVHNLLQDLEIPVVLDADGLNALSGHIDILDSRTAPTVLTPHDGEFQRLTGEMPGDISRLELARNFAKAHGCVLVLKGHTTITAASDGRTILNVTGNPGMAKGGCGDVLAGMLAGFLGQKHLRDMCADLAHRVASVVFYHGKVGDRCAQRLGEYGMTPTDMLEELPAFLRTQERRE